MAERDENQRSQKYIVVVTKKGDKTKIKLFCQGSGENRPSKLTAMQALDNFLREVTKYRDKIKGDEKKEGQKMSERESRMWNLVEGKLKEGDRGSNSGSK